MLFLACGQKAPVGVINQLPYETIVSIQTSASGGSWSQNLLQTPLAPGSSHSFRTGTGQLRIMATDTRGSAYLHETTLNSGGVIWEILPEHETAVQINPWAGATPVTITNSLTRPITRIRCSPSNRSAWGENWISQPLQPGQSTTFRVTPDTYDIRLEDGASTYTRMRVAIPAEGYAWSVTQQHRDASG